MINSQLTKNDWLKISYKLFFALFGLAMLLYNWIDGLLELKNLQTFFMKDYPDNAFIDYYNIDGNTYTLNFFSFFTYQSNIFGILFFLLAGILPYKEGNSKLLSQKVAVFISVYLTITILIYNLLLLPNLIITNDAPRGVGWLKTESMHAIIPLAFVIYTVVLFNNKVTINFKQYFKKELWYVLFYPLVWVVIALIRGALASYQNWINQFNMDLASSSGVPFEYIYYNYFFLELSTKISLGLPRIAWFFIALVVIFAMLIGFALLFSKLINLTLKKTK